PVGQVAAAFSQGGFVHGVPKLVAPATLQLQAQTRMSVPPSYLTSEHQLVAQTFCLCKRRLIVPIVRSGEIQAQTRMSLPPSNLTSEHQLVAQTFCLCKRRLIVPIVRSGELQAQTRMSAPPSYLDNIRRSAADAAWPMSNDS